MEQMTIDKLLCFLGIHKWKHYPPIRRSMGCTVCERCDKRKIILLYGRP